MRNQIKIIAFTENGSTEVLYIIPEMLIDLLSAIQDKGSEYVHTKDKTILVTGILFKGKGMKNKVIIIDNKERE